MKPVCQPLLFSGSSGFPVADTCVDTESCKPGQSQYNLLFETCTRRGPCSVPTYACGGKASVWFKSHKKRFVTAVPAVSLATCYTFFCCASRLEGAMFPSTGYWILGTLEIEGEDHVTSTQARDFDRRSPRPCKCCTQRCCCPRQCSLFKLIGLNL